ncbi:testis-expressed protein 2 [Synchiropus splendidus]|uniref:testis-expressed protein 2 n=1 Tax=Synchiropus splendidus TaxID=270530 RepID=UPI00237E0FF7|nr:testis-expressed protein 2 [Synchiropus splendidus]
MADIGAAERRRDKDGGRRGGGSLQGTNNPAQDHSPVGAAPLGTKRHLPRGIVIQLTGTEGEWNSLDESELIFSLDRDEDYPPISLSKEKQLSVDDDSGLQSPAFHVPLSPSSPSSLGHCSNTGASFLSPGPSTPTHRPLASLVKSLSTELEPKEGSTLRPKPLLNLVKSISTELSRSEPEVSQSKSDSRLNLHLWKQLTKPKNRSNGDSRTAPPSPSNHSPLGDNLKGNFFKMELEDTKRKLSEAVQEPLSSMLNKMRREESTGSPKHQHKTQGPSNASSKATGVDGLSDFGALESPASGSRSDSELVFHWPPVRHSGKGQRSPCPVHHKSRKEEKLEITTDGDMMQIFAVATKKQKSERPTRCKPSDPMSNSAVPPYQPLPRLTLFCAAVLSYGYFVLPLTPYCSGLALGVALGFLLGLCLIRMSSSKSTSSVSQHRAFQLLLSKDSPSNESEVVKGWMNESHDYDAETCHLGLTHSVFATLEGSCLRLDSPRSNIGRRATFDEKVPETTFIKTRSFHLARSKVFLLPSVLAQKRLWNPKYPICIQLHEGMRAEDEDKQQLKEDHEQGETRQKSSEPQTLYLFGRTGRDKEEWFRHFLLASSDRACEKERAGRCVSRLVNHHNGPSSPGSCSDENPVPSSTSEAPTKQSPSITRGPSELDYAWYMSRLLGPEESTPMSSPGACSTETSPGVRGKCTCDPADECGSSHNSWANALIGRIFWDFLREKYWSDAVSHKIQKKLSKIKLPYFMNELTLAELDMGNSMPQIASSSRPEVNHRGLWVELQLVYTGALQMTLQTKFNLSKLGKDGGQDMDCITEPGSTRCRPVLQVLADSDEESSSAGSSDEEDLLLSEPQVSVGDKGSTAATEGAGGGRTGRKILRFVDKIAKSKYFQKATETEFIKKKFEEMSNTPLLLTVEVQELSGTLVINIPPPPTDRIWYSFCVPPKLDLHVCPKLGEREVTLCHVTEWIEKKLQDEFQKVFVMPNMDDIYLPVMHSGTESPQASLHLSSRSYQSSTESIERIPTESD